MAPVQSSPRLPLEIQYNVLDLIIPSHEDLASLRDPSVISRTLCSCALTCYAWSTHCQRLLYNIVLIRDSKTLETLIANFNARPSLQQLVRGVHVHVYPADVLRQPLEVAFLLLLPRLPNVESWTMSFVTTWKFSRRFAPVISRKTIACITRYGEKIRTLVMRSIQFPTIMDLARLLLAFTAVKTVYLEDVQTVLDNPVEGSPLRLLKQRFNERFKDRSIQVGICIQYCIFKAIDDHINRSQIYAQIAACSSSSLRTSRAPQIV